MVLGVFTNRLNKVGENVYTIEEAVQVPAGVYDANLAHDNVTDDTVAVYTGPDLTGNPVHFTLATPQEAPWKRRIHIETEAQTVYISYETVGDQVEADDINSLQSEMLRTQGAVNDLTQIVTGAAQGFTWGRLSGVTGASTLAIQGEPEDQTCEAGDSVTFTITATGDGITYQWQYFDTEDSRWRNFTSGNASTLTITPTAAWDGRRIQCRLSDNTGNTLYSDAVTLTVV